jgi:hypothetical protein
VVQFAALTLAGRNVRLRTYGGAIPGPLVRTKPGAKLSFHIDNQLPPYDSSAWHSLTGLSHTVLMNIPHNLNTTNLHVHGLEVIPHLFEPVGTSDPSAHMIAIEPGEKKDYTFELPDNHPTGLYWYHPHHHGSTSVQVANGMAGVIIVEGAIDEVPEIAAAKDLELRSSAERDLRHVQRHELRQECPGGHHRSGRQRLHDWRLPAAALPRQRLACLRGDAQRGEPHQPHRQAAHRAALPAPSRRGGPLPHAQRLQRQHDPPGGPGALGVPARHGRGELPRAA